MDDHFYRGEIMADPDAGRFPIKLRDNAIQAAYSWLTEKKLVLAEDSDDDEMVFGDDDFPDYYDEPATDSKTESESAAAIFADIDQGQDPGADEYKTFDDDAILGRPCPGRRSIEFLNSDKFAVPIIGEIFVIFMWGQYHKPGYKFLPLYSQLQKKYGDKVKFMAVSMDPSIDYPKKFLEDPGKKYSTVFTTEFLVGWDKKGELKKSLMREAQVATLSPPHSFVIAPDGNIVWHQDHSELGATAPYHLALFEAQLDALVAGQPLKKMGDRPFVAGGDDDEEAVDVAMDGDGDDAFDFL
jgi:thiol-disulfide isomerase/thioredoxin